VLIYIYSTQEKKEKKKRTTQLAIVVCLREEERKKKETFRLCKFPTAFTAVKGAVGSDDDER
jgi:hypothetical protein